MPQSLRIFEPDLCLDTPTTQAAEEPSLRSVSDALRAGICLKDRSFDQFLPFELSVVSWQYWTPLAVAKRVAQWLTEYKVETVVDIGSGAGKFCVAAALFGRSHYIGLEQRPRLVSAARDLARRFEVDARVSFIEGAFGEIPAPSADAYYLYNPFGENIFDFDDHLDEEVELNHPRFLRDTTAAVELLQGAPNGTYLLTYNGFGGTVPESYQELRTDRELPNVLRMWRKG